MNNVKVIKIGGMELRVVSDTLDEDSKIENRLSYYKEVIFWAGLVVGILKIIGGLR